MPRPFRTPPTQTVVALLVVIGLVAAVLIVQVYGGESFLPGLVAGFLGTLVAFVLALAWERERGHAELAQERSELYERRQTETRRRLEVVRSELKKNAKSLGTLLEAFEAKEKREAMATSVVVEDSVQFLVNPQLLEGAWSASAPRLAELVADYQLIGHLATFHGRLEELRWRIRLRTEQRSPDLDGPIRALVVEMSFEVADLLKRVDKEIQNPHVRPTGLVQVRSIGAAVETNAPLETKVIRGDAPAAPAESKPPDE